MRSRSSMHVRGDSSGRQTLFGRIPKWGALALALSLCGPIQAQTNYLFNTGTAGSSYNNNLVVGGGFTVGTNWVRITRLGVYDKDSDGLGTGKAVGLWYYLYNSTWTLVAQADVPGGTTGQLVNAGGSLPCRYAALDSAAGVRLKPGSSYRIGAYFPSSPDAMGSGGSWTTSSDFSGLVKYYRGGVTNLQVPGTTGANIFGANAEYVIENTCYAASYGAVSGGQYSRGFVVGYRFTVGSSNVLVTALGAYDEGRDGFSGPVDVGLFTEAGDLITSLTLPAGKPGVLQPDNGWRTMPLDVPVELKKNTSYQFGVFYTDPTNDKIRENVTLSSNTEVTYTQSVYDSTPAGQAGLKAPGVYVANYNWAVGTFEYTVLPPTRGTVIMVR